jgi:cell division protein FtsW
MVLRPGQILQLLVMALLGLALVMVHSAGMTVGQPGGGGSILASRHLAYAIVAVAVMMIVSRLDVRSMFNARGWANPLPWIIVVAIGLTLHVQLFGRTINGARRWGSLLGVSYQPSELIKWTLVIALAWWCSRRQYVMRRFFHGLLPPLLLVGFGCGLVIIEDLGTAALIGSVAMLMLLAGGAKLWHMALITPAPIIAVVAAIMTSPYRLARIMSFRDPWVDPEGTGYHAIQSMIAIAGGSATGRGLGNGIQKFGYLPEDTTDFVFAIICEELGIVGAVLVVAIYLTLIWTAIGVVRDCRDAFGRLLALGVLLTVGLQALMNLAVVTVMVPTKGIALPLISAGGTGWIATAAAIGLVAALDEANHLDDVPSLDDRAAYAIG